MTESDIIVNTDWIDDEIRLFNENGLLQQEPMKKIDIIHLYINSSSELIKTHKTTHTFIGSHNILYSNDIFRYYLQNNTLDSVKYKFFQLHSYNIDLGDKLYTNIKSVSTIDFLKISTHIKDIHINPSLFIFHGTNSIYIIYKEKIKNSKNVTLKNKIKSDIRSLIR
jgi:hypothetical protein